LEVHLKKIKNNEVRNYLFVGSVLIILYVVLNNIGGIMQFFSGIVSVLMPFIIGGAIAFIINVPMKQIEKHLWNKEKYHTERLNSLRRVCAYLITLILVIAVITTAMFVIMPQLVETIADLFREIPEGVNRLQQYLLSELSHYPQIEDRLSSLVIDWDSLLKSSSNFISSGTKGIISGGIGAVSGIISGLTTFLIGFVFSIYILFQKENLSRQLKKLLYAMLSEKTATKVLEIADLTNTTFANFLSGQCVEAIILGSMFVVSMLILRMPYALLIGIVISLTALIPIVGAFIGCFVGVILIALGNPMQALGFLVLFLVLQQIEGNLIYPHVVGSSVGLPGIWVLVAVTIGGSLFGIPGILMFIPICSVAYALLRTFVNNRLDQKEKEKEETEENT
jgi:predicted PurR-regulated permease PerM